MTQSLTAQVALLRDALREIMRHDGRQGSEDWHAIKHFDARVAANDILSATESLPEKIRQATEWQAIESMPLRAAGLCAGDALHDSEFCINDGHYVQHHQYKWWHQIPPLPPTAITAKEQKDV